MTPRIRNTHALAPAAIKAMTALEHSFAGSGLDPNLLELVRLRVSQINGCAFCIHMHSTVLRRAGVPEMHLHMLPAWRESTFYSPRERAALGWAETLTRVAETGAPDADYAALQDQFGEAEQVWLTFVIGAINTWNRLQVGFRAAHPAEAELAAA
ncbi:carboxymuconolactone decarboxylase family protein [Sphingomonas jatrophae]|uniref:Alkylhydroperoxidase AhpD family core domain-containing protein n=1 Tax=Sphingomonas jatrophae TaxID=1166337 RepID=A0A1I6JTF7_9SPHN|nr:carboxymuconolactone decarboxylase family protein [Sphingomonas jatrophae]SFR82198.1 alkylhydroperoxidase AhpD family core domain-containing protein [Sphingomonas jatrophae]